MTSRRLLLLLLAPAASLAAHGLAYGPFGGGHGDDGGLHAYLPLAAAIVLPVAIAALLWAATCPPGRALQLPTVRALVATQLGVFGVQEVAERLASRVSLSELVTQPAVRWGLALQLLTAAACLLAIRLLRRTIGAFLTTVGRAELRFTAPIALVPVCGAPRVATGIVRRPPSRGPPVVAA